MLKARASANVSFAGRVSHEMKRHYLERAKASVFAEEEDFGIALVEAQACGTSAIAFGRGGAAEIVMPGETGLLFDEQTPEAIVSAIDCFERMPSFDSLHIGRNASRFRVPRFRREFRAPIDRAMQPPIRAVTRGAREATIETFDQVDYPNYDRSVSHTSVPD